MSLLKFRRNSSELPTLAWCSSVHVNGAGSCLGEKSASVTDALVPFLADHFRVTLFSQSPGTLVLDTGSKDVLPLSELNGRGPFDHVVLQVEDSPDAECLLGPSASGASLVWAHDLHRRSGGLLFSEPLQGPGVLAFSSERNVGEWNRRCHREEGGGQSIYLPYAVRPGETRPTREARRFVTAATPLVEDQMHLVIPVVGELGLDLVWLVADDEISAARAMLAERSVPGKVLGGRSLRLWSELLATAEAAFHFHHSAYGDCGPYLQQSLWSGCAVLVNDYSDSALLPGSVCLKILPGADFADHLRQALLSLDQPTRDALSEGGRQYALEFHSPSVVAAELSDLLKSGRNMAIPE
ncbi:MAG: hypothetical protein U0136_01040 [Bdellovibrionota bacterium]